MSSLWVLLALVVLSTSPNPTTSDSSFLEQFQCVRTKSNIVACVGINAVQKLSCCQMEKARKCALEEPRKCEDTVMSLLAQFAVNIDEPDCPPEVIDSWNCLWEIYRNQILGAAIVIGMVVFYCGCWRRSCRSNPRPVQLILSPKNY